jgi:hypothetical protein
MRRTVGIMGLTLALAACGGSSGSSVSGGTEATTPTATTAPAVTEAAITEPPATATPEPTTEAASMAPGSVAYRVANLTSAAVDVYVRTQGVVHAFPAAGAVAPGSVTDDLLPPEPGEVVVLPSGASGPTDPACVIDCAFLAESSTNFGEGDRRLLVVRDDGATEYWEHPDPASVGTTANALPPADPARALLIAEAQGVTDATFGLRVAYAGVPGCQADTTASSFLLGGTVVMTYPMDPAGANVTLHGNNDKDCSAAAVGGPFPVTGAVGSRTLLLLWGTMGAMQGLATPLP